MMLGVVFGLLGIGMLITFMFKMAVLALPQFVAVTTGRAAYEMGTGALGAIVVGFIAGAAALGVGQAVLTMTCSTVIRISVVLAFTAPAAFAGYHVVLGLSHIGGAQGCGSRSSRHRLDCYGRCFDLVLPSRWRPS